VPDVPTPFSPSLEDEILPDTEDIVGKLRELA
jgi:pyruvate/2-oxoglutarate/acetoin dehydrogenase E1 component